MGGPGRNPNKRDDGGVKVSDAPSLPCAPLRWIRGADGDFKMLSVFGTIGVDHGRTGKIPIIYSGTVGDANATVLPYFVI